MCAAVAAALTFFCSAVTLSALTVTAASDALSATLTEALYRYMRLQPRTNKRLPMLPHTRAIYARGQVGWKFNINYVVVPL